MIRREAPAEIAAALKSAREAPLLRPAPVVIAGLAFVCAQLFAFMQELRLAVMLGVTLLFGLVGGAALANLYTARRRLITGLEQASGALLCFRDLVYGIVYVDARGVFVEQAGWHVPWSAPPGKPRLQDLEYDPARHALVMTVQNLMPPTVELTLPPDVTPEQALRVAAARPAQSLQTTLP